MLISFCLNSCQFNICPEFSWFRSTSVSIFYLIFNLRLESLLDVSPMLLSLTLCFLRIVIRAISWVCAYHLRSSKCAAHKRFPFLPFRTFGWLSLPIRIVRRRFNQIQVSLACLWRWIDIVSFNLIITWLKSASPICGSVSSWPALFPYF